MLPTAGLSDQVTAVFVVPVTAAVNCCVCEPESAAAVGLIVILTVVDGCRIIIPLAVFVESAPLVAVTVTFCWDVIVPGAI
jgi:hypothetical protein